MNTEKRSGEKPVLDLKPVGCQGLLLKVVISVIDPSPL